MGTQTSSSRSANSKGTTFLLVMVVSIIAAWIVVTAIVMTMAETTTLGAIGVGAFGAFWLGGGFGAIFGSAAAFGGDH